MSLGTVTDEPRPSGWFFGTLEINSVRPRTHLIYRIDFKNVMEMADDSWKNKYCWK